MIGREIDTDRQSDRQRDTCHRDRDRQTVRYRELDTEAEADSQIDKVHTETDSQIDRQPETE